MKGENIMKYKQFLKSIRLDESNKDNFLNDILDKISNKSKLSEREKDFLNNYEDIDNDDIIDYNLLNNNLVYTKVSKILSLGKSVIFNLTDKDGKIDSPIISIDGYDGKIWANVKSHGEVNIPDNKFYNLIYNFKDDSYSLEDHDEYYEEITKEI
jgi:hypothetical protein